MRGSVRRPKWASSFGPSSASRAAASSAVRPRSADAAVCSLVGIQIHPNTSRFPHFRDTCRERDDAGSEDESGWPKGNQPAHKSHEKDQRMQTQPGADKHRIKEIVDRIDYGHPPYENDQGA